MPAPRICTAALPSSSRSRRSFDGMWRRDLKGGRYPHGSGCLQGALPGGQPERPEGPEGDVRGREVASPDRPEPDNQAAPFTGRYVRLMDRVFCTGGRLPRVAKLPEPACATVMHGHRSVRRAAQRDIGRG